MYLSVFSDELATDVTQALPMIKSWGMSHVDFRGRVFRKGIEMLDDKELKELRKLCDDNGLSVACLQTSLCKVHLPDAERQQKEAEKLEGIIRAAEALDCRLVRSFHYWQPGKNTEEKGGALAVQPDAMQKVLDMFGPIADRAREAGLLMAFENCGVTTDEVFALLDALDVPEWGMAWDVANTWDCDERLKDEDAYIERMIKRSLCVHVKARGALPDLIKDLKEFRPGKCGIGSKQLAQKNPQRGLKRELIPYGKVLSACHNLGMPGPVSAETHNPDKSVSDVDRTQQLIQAIRRAWPAAAPESEAKNTGGEAVVRDWDDNPVGFLVVGLGMGHENAKKVNKASGCRLVAVADLVEDRAKRTGEHFDVPYGTDYKKWLDDAAVEVVYVVTETGNHARVALEALKAGKHVLTTKPMEASLEAVDTMIKLAEEKGLILAVDFGRRFDNATLALKKGVEEGVFGKLLSAECSLKILRTMEYFQKNGGWRGTRKLDGGGVLSNQAIHNIDEIVFCFGVPAKVRANIWTQTHDIEAEDVAFATWQYENGFVLSLHATTSYPQPTWYSKTEITGEKGAYSHAAGGPYDKPMNKWYVDGAWSDEAPHPVKSEWLNAPDNMAAHIRTGAPLVCDGRDGRRSQAVLDAMYRSAYENNGDWVELR
ncbi:MAG: TIM barrel protein [Lentisphaeria bacterium]|nr:TIM barrel protein [Lentisphaeria bacterium]